MALEQIGAPSPQPFNPYQNRQNLSAVVQHAGQTEMLMTGSNPLYKESEQWSASDAFTKGAPIAIARAGKVLYDSSIGLLTNESGYDTDEDFDKFLSHYDESWQQYYADHKLGVNLTSELLASFVPGGLAVKAVRASRAGLLGSKYLNVFSKFEDAQKKFKDAAALASVNRGMADEVIRNTWKARGVAVGDAYAEGAVIAAATYAGLNQADIFDDYSANRFLTDTIFGGTIIAPFKYLQAGKAIREGITQAEQKYNAANVIRGSEAGTPGWQKSATQIEDAERMQDMRAAQESRTRATQEFSKTYIDASTTKGFVDRLVDRFKGITTEDFLTDYSFVKKILPWAKGPKYDLATDTGKISYLKSKGAIARYSENLANAGQAVPKKINVHFIAPTGSKSKIADIFDTDVYLNPNSADAKAALATVQKNNPGLGYEIQTLSVSPKRILVPGPAQLKNAPGFKTGAMVVSSVKNLPNTAAWKDMQDLYGLTRMTSVADDEQLLLPFRSLNIRTGKNFEGAIEPYSGDFGLDFHKNPNHVTVGKQFFNADEFEGIFDVDEAWKSDVMFLLKGRQAERNPERYFKLSGDQGKSLTQNSPGKYGFYENDLHSLQAGYMRGDKYTNIIRGTPDGSVDTITRSQLEDLIIQKKQEFFAKGLNDHNLSADDLAVRLDMDVDKVLSGDKNGFFNYTKAADLEKYSSPTHITIQYEKTGGQVRQNLLTNYDRNSFQDARAQSNWAILGPEFGNLFDIDQLTRNIDNEMLTATSQSRGPGLVNFADSHRYADLDAYASHIGGLKQQADQKLVESFVQDIQAPLQPFLKGGADGTSAAALRLELDAVINQVRGTADPVKFQFVGTSGRGTLVNGRTGEAIVRNDISGPTSDLLSKEVSDFLRSWTSANDTHFVGRANSLVDVFGMGEGSKLAAGNLYFPPPDTRLRPNFGLVVDNVTNKKTMIFASDGADLERKIELVKQKFPSVDVYTKNDVKRYKQIFDEFDRDEWFASHDFDSTLKKAGITSTLVPSADALSLEELQRFISKQANGLNRRAITAYLSPEFETLGVKAQQFDDAILSRRGTFARTALGTSNPFSGYMKTMLNESRLSEMPWLKQMNSAAASMVSSAFEGLKKVLPMLDPKNDAKLASQEIQGQLNAIGKQFGVGFDYSDTASLRTLQNYFAGDELQGFVSKYNGLLANLNLTVDAFYHISNILSAPMLQAPEMRSLWKNLQTDPNVQRALGVALPNNVKMPSPMKIMMSTTRRLFDDTTAQKMAYWKDKGIIDIDSLEATQKMRNVFDSLKNPGSSEFTKKFGEVYNDTFDFLKKRTVDPINSWIKFYAADATEQIARSAGITDQKVIDNLAWTMTRRVGGNYISGQRPILFQGPIGHAIGLFQTFTFSVIQNLSRYAADKDTAALKSFLTGQVGMFGANSNPIYRYANQYIAQQNPERADLQTAAYGVGEQSLGDLLVYGFPSVAFNASIYTRGDLTPINPGIIPTSLSEIPIVRSLSNYANTIGTLHSKLSSTGIFNGNAWLSGISAANISRPLTGLVQLAQGESYDRSGNLITSGIRDFTAWTRLAGGRPFDEAKLLDRYYKTKAYEAEDAQRVRDLSSGIKNKLSDGVEPTSEEMADFADKYIRAGGSYRGFKRWMQNQMLNANTDMSERLRKKVSDDPNFETWRQVLYNTEGMSEGDTKDVLSVDPLAETGSQP